MAEKFIISGEQKKQEKIEWNNKYGKNSTDVKNKQRPQRGKNGQIEPDMWDGNKAGAEPVPLTPKIRNASSGTVVDDPVKKPAQTAQPLKTVPQPSSQSSMEDKTTLIGTEDKAKETATVHSYELSSRVYQKFPLT